MEITRYEIMKDVFSLSQTIEECSELLKDATTKGLHLSTIDPENPSDEAKKFCANINRCMKFVSRQINEVKEYVAEHGDKEMAQHFIRSVKNANSLKPLADSWLKLVYKSSFAANQLLFTTKILAQFFLDGQEFGTTDIEVKSVNRSQAMEILDNELLTFNKYMPLLECSFNNDTLKEAMLANGIFGNRARINILKQYIVENDDKQMAQLFCVPLYSVAKLMNLTNSASTLESGIINIKCFTLLYTMCFIKRTVLADVPNIMTNNQTCPAKTCENESSTSVETQLGSFSTIACVPTTRLYKFLIKSTVQSGSDKGKSILDGNSISDADFTRAVVHSDYLLIYNHSVKGKMRCVITLLSKAYFKEWKKYRENAATSIGLSITSLTKYNVDKTFISQLKEQLPMIK